MSPGKRPSIERLITALDEFESFPDRTQPAAVDPRDTW